MTSVRLNIFGYVMLTMGAFWGAFSGTGAWRYDTLAQFGFFALLVFVWSFGSMAMMTWSGRQKAKDANEAELRSERVRESEALSVTDDVDGDVSVKSSLV